MTAEQKAEYLKARGWGFSYTGVRYSARWEHPNHAPSRIKPISTQDAYMVQRLWEKEKREWRPKINT
jgi:hypothetical protein